MKQSSTILIVDDNPQNLQYLGKILRDNKNSVEFATNGESALEWLTVKKFDLILLDVNMLGIDGYEVCSRIRRDMKNYTPIIFLSAETDREKILKGFELGGQDYVTKPFDSRELFSRIQTHLALKHSLENLEVEKEKALSADHLKSAFLATMSHELRTPLNSIIGFTSILLKGNPGPLTDEQQKQLEMVRGSARHLLSLINDILDISKIEAGQLRLNIEAVNVPEIIHDVIETCTPLAEKKNLTVELIIDKSINLIKSDRLRLKQIFLNLLNNAIKFTDAGMISINCTQPGSYIEFIVSDAGIGIPSDKLKDIFNPFIQAETGLTRRHEGTGLGLSISKKLTELLHGSIKAESALGKGSSFTVIIPVDK